MNLSSGEIETLRGLSSRSEGDQSFVKIAAAQALTGRGLAVKTRGGWAITGAGMIWLGERGAATAGSGVVISFPGAQPGLIR